MKLIDLIKILHGRDMLSCEIVGDLEMEATSNGIGFLCETPGYLAEQEIESVEINKPEDDSNLADLYIELKGNDFIYDRK